MPPLDVAPIYTDAFAKTIYEGMAIIIEENIRSVETTLLGVTCRLYWVKFFYTEINLLRWVDVAAIAAWSDPFRHYIPINSTQLYSTVVNLSTEFRALIYHATGVAAYFYLDMPQLSKEDIILACGCLFSIPTTADPVCNVRLSLFNQPSTTPNNTAVEGEAAYSYSQSDTYIPLALSLLTPISLDDTSSMSLRLRIYQKILLTSSTYVYAKSFWLDTVRTI